HYLGRVIRSQGVIVLIEGVLWAGYRNVHRLRHNLIGSTCVRLDASSGSAIRDQHVIGVGVEVLGGLPRIIALRVSQPVPILTQIEPVDRDKRVDRIGGVVARVGGIIPGQSWASQPLQ